MSRTTWDRIYKRYKNGGPAWATLSNPIHPAFRQFVKRTRFGGKTVLDLGCGDGRYLKLLQMSGFAISGIDSSPTAIQMSKEILGRKSLLHVADIFTYAIPSRRYDLVICIATIQHARKPAIKRLIGRIHRSLRPDGKIFITFPMTSSLSHWNTFKNAKMAAPGVYIPLTGPEKGLSHSFYKKEELRTLFSSFSVVKITGDGTGRWVVRAAK